VRETAEIVARRLADLAVGTRVMIGFQIPVVSIPPVVAKEAASDTDAVDDLFEGEEPLNGVTPESRIPHPGVEETLNTLQRRGYGRLLVDGRAVAFDEIERASLKDRTTLDVIVDRVRIEGDLRSRLTDSIETSYREGGGAAFAIVAGDRGLGTGDSEGIASSPQAQGPSPYRIEFSERFECRTCGITYETPQPRLFSFNNPFGACPTCHGFGNVIELDLISSCRIRRSRSDRARSSRG
jgi:excinuclease ABC subunit A